MPVRKLCGAIMALLLAFILAVPAFGAQTRPSSAEWPRNILEDAPPADSSDTHAPRPLSSKDKLVAITFDDGPGPYTGQLLDELAARDIKATFFVFGSKIDEKTVPLLRRIAEEGHSIGSHTYNHARLTALSNAQILAEMSKNDECIAGVTGQIPELMRPPFGAYDRRVINSCGKPVILWSLDTRDWELQDAKTVCKNIVNNVQDGDIILLHELDLSSKEGVVAAIDILAGQGYNFVTIPELFRLRGITLEAGKHYHDARREGTLDAGNPSCR